MVLINKNWLAANEQRRYPLADGVTGIDDTGVPIPLDVLVDAHISWPSNYGKIAFIGGLTVTDKLVTLVIMAADTEEATEFTPLGSVTLVKPLSAATQYPVLAAVAGVGGFVAFGNTTTPAAIRCATAKQSKLLPRLAIPYTPLPVASLGIAERDTSLVNIVKIIAASNLLVSLETVLLGEEETLAVMVQLQSDAVNNTFAAFTGPCGGRPESGTCKLPGIETISGVAPDCYGNIELVFQQLVIGNFPECNSIAAGFILDQGVGLADVCTPRFLFPLGGGVDKCNPEDVASSDSVQPSTSSGSVTVPSSSIASPPSSDVVVCTDLPFTECFDGELDPDWVTAAGTYQFVTAINPNSLAGCESSTQGIQLTRLTGRNALAWNACSYSNNLDMVVVADVQLVRAVLTTPANVGVLLNYGGSSATTFWVAGVDAADNKLKLWRYNGTSLIVENSVTLINPLNYGSWYRLTVTAAGSGGLVVITAILAAANNPASVIAGVSIGTALYGAPDGKHGIFSNRAAARCSGWSIADA